MMDKDDVRIATTRKRAEQFYKAAVKDRISIPYHKVSNIAEFMIDWEDTIALLREGRKANQK